jgi:hypothetical protein
MKQSYDMTLPVNREERTLHNFNVSNTPINLRSHAYSRLGELVMMANDCKDLSTTRSELSAGLVLCVPAKDPEELLLKIFDYRRSYDMTEAPKCRNLQWPAVLKERSDRLKVVANSIGAKASLSEILGIAITSIDPTPARLVKLIHDYRLLKVKDFDPLQPEAPISLT